MTRVSLDDASSYQSLLHIYDRTRVAKIDAAKQKSIISTGADGITLEEFDKQRDQHLRAISRKISSGRYTFTPRIEVEIPKENGKIRNISIPCIRDLIAEKSISKVLVPHVEEMLTDSAFAYQPGRSAQQAVRKIYRMICEGRHFIFESDFQSFFDTLSHELMIDTTKCSGVCDKTFLMVRRYLATPSIPSHQIRRNQRQNVRIPSAVRFIGIPQGGVLSGVLSNAYLASYDLKLTQIQEGLVRYADDFVVCCDSPAAAMLTYKNACELATEFRLCLNPKKTQMCVDVSCNSVDFLGFNISARGIRISRKNIGKFKSRFQSTLDQIPSDLKFDDYLNRLIFSASLRIKGLPDEECRWLHNHLQVRHPHRRCWIGFFRIITDDHDVRKLDNWVRAQISKRCWCNYRKRIRYNDMRDLGLPTLRRILDRCRKPYNSTA